MARKPADRADIRRWFPTARSVVLLGFSHAGPPEPPPSEPGRGRFARYARSRDYHRDLRARTRAVLTCLKDAAPGAEGKAFVDTSPVLERLYARWAGLGWVGKNTLLVNPRRGSQFFLTGFATDVALAPDSAVADHCGSCTRCIDACPTDAFPEPRVLDANRCITYLNAETDAPVPTALRPGVGDWVFGCDVCQDVCPFNRFSRGHPLFPEEVPASLPLEVLATLTEAAFDRLFGRLPVGRGGRAALVRNALLSMGNSGQARFIPVLERFATDSDEVLSEQARWSLERLRGPDPK